MTTVNQSLKETLYKKGWRYELSETIHPNKGVVVNHSLAEQRWNEGNLTYVDITIDEVVNWLYNRYGLWPCIDKAEGFSYWKFNIRKLKDIGYDYGGFGCNFNSPTEAYLASFEYILANLI